MSSQAEGAVRLVVFDRAWFREEFYTAIQRKHDKAELQPERKASFFEKRSKKLFPGRGSLRPERPRPK
jgi:hypothetical protein